MVRQRQHPAHRQPLHPAGRSGARQSSTVNFLFYDPVTGAFGTSAQDFGSLKLPAYNLVNVSAGLKWDSGLEFVAYANNLFDKNPKLSLDRERGGRARLRLQHRHSRGRSA